MDGGTRRETHVSGCKASASLPCTSPLPALPRHPGTLPAAAGSGRAAGGTSGDSEAGPRHAWPAALACTLAFKPE